VVLNKYYAKMDESIMYRCAMSMYYPIFSSVSNYSNSTWALAVLHPKYKLSYFRTKKWPEEWIETAKEVLREQWLTNYKPGDPLEATSQSSSSVCLRFFQNS
jgi:hypothetical protein